MTVPPILPDRGAGDPPLSPRESAALRLPRELRTFLAAEGSRTMLVRGPPGSGKTPLAARLVEALGRPVVWVSTRFGRQRGSSPSFPGLREEPGSLRRVDLSLAERARQGDDHAFEEARRNLLLRDGEAGWTAPLDWLPPVLRDAFPPPSERSAPITVAIDSWEGLVDHYLDAPRRDGAPEARPGQVERFLLAQLAERVERLVLLTEHEEQTGLDFLMDGVLVTASGDFDDRLVRVMMIAKLAGVPVEETVYPFTLEEGQFTYIHRLSPNPKIVYVGYTPDPSPSSEGVWPGSPTFHEAFGRLPLGGISLLERDPAVPSEFLRLLTAPFAAQVIQGGGRLVGILPTDVTPLALYEQIRDAGGADVLATQVRFLTSAATDDLPDDARRVVLPLFPPKMSTEVPFVPLPDAPAGQSNERVFPEVTRFLRSADPRTKSGLSIDLEGLQAAALATGRMYTPQNLPALIQMDVQGRPVHAMVAGRSDDPLLSPIRTFANPYIRILERRGRIFLYGIRPWTSAYVLLPEARDTEAGPYYLTRMS